MPTGPRGFPLRSTLWRAALLAAVAVTGVVIAYRETIHFGFRYDDFHVLRPWTRAEILAISRGNWDPTGIESKFYRPLTAGWYALRFVLFGLNPVPQHIVSLAGTALCSFLTGLFVWREIRRLFAALVAAALYTIYPAFVYAQAIWLTNQMHLFSSLTVLVALIVWQRARTKGGAAWWWLIVLQAIAFGFKEDTIMLLPVLGVLTVLRAWLIGQTRVPDWRVITAAVAVLLVLPYWRYVALGRHLGGYGKPGFDRGWSNLSHIIDVFLQRPARRPWQAVAGWYSGMGLAAGIAAAALRRSLTSVYLLMCGAAIALLFNLPFYLASKAEQYHLVAFGCVLALAGAIDAVQQSTVGRTGRVAAALVAAPALVFLPITRNIAQDFAPCSTNTLYTDDLSAGWMVVPHEIREWLRAKPDRCRAGTLVPLPQALRTVIWANGRETDETGTSVEWTSDRAVVFVTPSVSRANITVRTPVASPRTPSTIVVKAGAGEYRIVLTDTAWHTQTIRLAPTLWRTLRGMSRLDIRVSPTFIPAERFRNNDRRVLGVLMRGPDVQ